MCLDVETVEASWQELENSITRQGRTFTVRVPAGHQGQYQSIANGDVC